MRLLDLGSGIGGPARYFAGHRGCRVTGVDLSAEFCDTAKELSSRTGLGDRTEYHQGSAASLPFPDATFDGAYMLHVGMNIPAKASVFREVARVLKPGAVFGIFDIMREAAGDLNFPLPWASGPQTSFVETAGTYTELLRAAGFAIRKQRSRGAFALFLRRCATCQQPQSHRVVRLRSASISCRQPDRAAFEPGVLSPIEIVSRKN